MAREFAKSFYKSKEWLKCRELIIDRDKGLCQECLKNGDIKPGEEVHHIEWLKPSNINNDEITLNPGNLELVCKDCHFKIHKSVRHDIRTKRMPSISNGYYFTDDGELKKTQTYIVYGSPGAGKNTYVEQHREYGDLVVDIDLLKRAISMEDMYECPDTLYDIVIRLRDDLYNCIRKKEVQARNIWIIATLPRRKERNELSIDMDAELIFIDTSIDECIANVINDTKRIDKKKQIELINKWYGCWEK